MSGGVLVVGLGPGGPEGISAGARAALDRADTIIGYGKYMELARPLLGDKETVAYGMGEEVKRAEDAVRRALSGRMAAVVSSGDPGIYGMASPVLEAAERLGLPLSRVTIIPGIPALAAAAALLGSPLANDFGVVSLSDLLTPWWRIEATLRRLASSDLSIVIYNPASKGRRTGLERALSILEAARGPETAIGIVRRAGREGESSVAARLGDLDRETKASVDMTTIIVAGSPSSRLVDGRIIEPRGYGRPREAFPAEAEEAERSGEPKTAAAGERSGAASTNGDAAVIPAVIPASPIGRLVAERIAEDLGLEVLRAPEPLEKRILGALYRSRDIVLVGSVGIASRLIAPLLLSKRSDPAVVVVDAAGRNVVSFASGHEGGANELARRVADALGGNAVITTASEACGIAVGIGCHDDADPHGIAEAVRAVLAERGIPLAGVNLIATLADRLPIVGRAADLLGIHAEGYSSDDLSGVEVSSPSASERHMGLPSVSEAAARRGAGLGELILEKTVRGGITIAAAMGRIETVVALFHGTRSVEGREDAKRFLGLLHDLLLRRGTRLETGYVELNDPPMIEALGRGAARGGRCVVLPILLFPGKHSRIEIPGTVSEAGKKYPGTEILLARPLGVTNEVLSILEDRFRDVADGASSGRVAHPGEAAANEASSGHAGHPAVDSVLLVGRGSKDPTHGAEVAYAARLLSGRLGLPVEAAFSDATTPDIPTGLHRLSLLGWRRPVVLPLLLFRGAVFEKIRDEAEEAGRRLGLGPLLLADPLGPGTHTAEAFIHRLEEALEKRILCATCPHRPG